MEYRNRFENLNKRFIVSYKFFLFSLLSAISFLLFVQGQYSYMLWCLFFLLVFVLVAEAYTLGVKDFIIKTNIGEIGIKMQEITKDIEKTFKAEKEGKVKPQEIDILKNKVNDINTAIEKANAFIDENELYEYFGFIKNKVEESRKKRYEYRKAI